LDFLDPDRPDIRYESDLTPEERERMAPQIEEHERRLAAHRQRVKAEYGIDIGPPWKIRWPDGTISTVGADVD
jgi:hypothetical protein